MSQMASRENQPNVNTTTVSWKGERGEPGERGPGVVPAEAVEKLERDIEKMRRDADTQFKRIAQLQARLDVTLAELQRLKQGK